MEVRFRDFSGDMEISMIGSSRAHRLAVAAPLAAALLLAAAGGPEDRLIHTHRNTRSLQEILAAMIRHSNNFTANPLLLAMGLERCGEPATLDKGLGLLQEYLTARLGIPPEMFHLVEGSGISRENRLHPEALVVLARAFHPHRSLLALQAGVPVKTGTLRGVYTMAGILDADRPLFFAIMLNQERNHRDRILSLLLGAFASDRVSMNDADPAPLRVRSTRHPAFSWTS